MANLSESTIKLLLEQEERAGASADLAFIEDLRLVLGADIIRAGAALRRVEDVIRARADNEIAPAWHRRLLPAEIADVVWASRRGHVVKPHEVVVLADLAIELLRAMDAFVRAVGAGMSAARAAGKL